VTSVRRARRELYRELIRTSETFFPRRWVNRGEKNSRGPDIGPRHSLSYFVRLPVTYTCSFFYRAPVVKDQTISSSSGVSGTWSSGLPARSFTPSAPPFILAVYLVFASNLDEGVSVTEVGSVEGFQLRAALIGLVLR
jgi:hypothetical protein